MLIGMSGLLLSENLKKENRIIISSSPKQSEKSLTCLHTSEAH